MSTTTLLIVYFSIGLGILIWFVSRDPDTFKGEKFSDGFGLFLGLAICYVALWPPILVCAAFQLVAWPLGKLIEKSFAKWDAVVQRGRVSKWFGQFILSRPAAEEIQAAQNWAAKNNEFDKRLVSGDYRGNSRDLCSPHLSRCPKFLFPDRLLD
jgi:hypothetical protein